MKRTYLYFFLLQIYIFNIQAQEINKTPENADALAEKLNNPTSAVGSMTSLIDFKTFQGNLPLANEQTALSITFQPSLPKPLKNGKNLLFRPAIPLIIKQPLYSGSFENSGVQLGDIGFDLAIGSTSKKGTLFLAGIVGSIPSATDVRLRGQWAFGPEVLLGKLTKKYVIGALISQKWDIEKGLDKTNVLAGQYFMFSPIGKGRTLGAAPNYSYDWVTKQLTFPLGFGYSSITNLGKTPFKYGLQVHYYVAKSEIFAPQWQFRIQLSPVVKLPWK